MRHFFMLDSSKNRLKTTFQWGKERIAQSKFCRNSALGLLVIRGAYLERAKADMKKFY